MSGAGPAGFKEHVRKPELGNLYLSLGVRTILLVTLGGKSLQGQLSAQD